MKNAIKTIGIIAIIAIMGLGVTSCKQEPEDPITLFNAGVGEQSVVKVINITPTYDNKWAILGIDTNPMGVAIGTKIESGTVFLKIINSSDNAKAAYAEGYYTAIIMIYNTETEANSSGGTALFSKGAINVAITKGEVSVDFTEFKW